MVCESQLAPPPRASLIKWIRGKSGVPDSDSPSHGGPWSRFPGLTEGARNIKAATLVIPVNECNGDVSTVIAQLLGGCRSSCRLSKTRPIRAYAATFETGNQYHFTPKWKVRLIGRIGHVSRASPHKTGCGEMGVAKLRITQTLATVKPTSAHRPILRCIVSYLSVSYDPTPR